MSTHAVSLATPRAARLLGPAFTIGGLLWIGDFVQIVANGLISGTLADGPDQELPLGLRIGLRLFVLSVVILGLGMAGLFTRLQSRSKKLAITGLLFTVIALALATANLVLLSGVLGAPSFKDTFMGLSIFSTSIAALFMSIGALRSGILPLGVAGPAVRRRQHHPDSVRYAAALRPRLGHRPLGFSDQRHRFCDSRCE